MHVVEKELMHSKNNQGHQWGPQKSQALENPCGVLTLNVALHLHPHVRTGQGLSAFKPLPSLTPHNRIAETL